MGDVPSEMTQQLLCDILSDAAIDWMYDDHDRSIYVTSLGFSFWLKFDPDLKCLHFTTLWPLKQEASEADVLRYVNHCNNTLLLSKFNTDGRRSRIRARYMLHYEDGFSRRHILRVSRLFVRVFLAAIHEEDHWGVVELQPGDEVFKEVSPKVMLN